MSHCSVSCCAYVLVVYNVNPKLNDVPTEELIMDNDAQKGGQLKVSPRVPTFLTPCDIMALCSNSFFPLVLEKYLCLQILMVMGLHV